MPAGRGFESGLGLSSHALVPTGAAAAPGGCACGGPSALAPSLTVYFVQLLPSPLMPAVMAAPSRRGPLTATAPAWSTVRKPWQGGGHKASLRALSLAYPRWRVRTARGNERPSSESCSVHRDPRPLNRGPICLNVWLIVLKPRQGHKAPPLASLALAMFASSTG